jgi:hypothetical protein
MIAMSKNQQYGVIGSELRRDADHWNVRALVIVSALI